MLKICICDDLSCDSDSLKKMINAYFRLREVPYAITVYQNGDELLCEYKPKKFHLLFLDIYMPGISGVDLARRIYSIDPKCNLIFATTSVDHAIDSFAVRAAGYLVKPYNLRQLEETIDWCLEHIAEQLQYVEIISDREKRAVLLNDICYIEVMGRASVLHAAKEAITTNRSLSELEQQLGSSFLRCHRSFIVNMEHIIKPRKDSFLLTDNLTVPISIDNVNKVKQQYFDWMFFKTWEGR